MVQIRQKRMSHDTPIAWMIISGLDMNGGLYFLSFFVWLLHLLINSCPECNCKKQKEDHANN